MTTRFGELMGIKGLPTTYDGYLALLVDYERRHFAHTPAATRLPEASIRIAEGAHRGDHQRRSRRPAAPRCCSPRWASSTSSAPVRAGVAHCSHASLPRASSATSGCRG